MFVCFNQIFKQTVTKKTNGLHWILFLGFVPSWAFVLVFVQGKTLLILMVDTILLA